MHGSSCDLANIFGTTSALRRHYVGTTSALRRHYVGTLMLAAVFAWAGLAKINDPTPASDFIVAIFSWRTFGFVRALGLVELVLSLWLISGVGRRWAAFGAAAFFTLFAVVHVYASTIDSQASCGCLGAAAWSDTVPPWGWASMNTLLALWAAMLTISPKRNTAQTIETVDELEPSEVTT